VSANRQNQGQSRGIPENYERADDRIANFRKDYPGVLGHIESIPIHNGDWCAFEARIYVRDAGAPGTEFVLIANAHAYDKWGLASQAEKTEKAAIGRALVMAGYAALRGASAEEMERNDEQERNGAPSAPTPLRRNTTQTPQNRPQTNGTPAHDSRTTSEDTGAQNTAIERVPWSEVDRDDFRPSYAVIIDKAWGKFESGETAEQIKAHFAANRKPMKDDEYADAQYRLGEILKAIRSRDTAVAQENAPPPVPPATGQELKERAVKPAAKRDLSVDEPDVDF
jgi:hypothetical protein